jgi:hypothetical protein
MKWEISVQKVVLMEILNEIGEARVEGWTMVYIGQSFRLWRGKGGAPQWCRSRIIVSYCLVLSSLR